MKRTLLLAGCLLLCAGCAKKAAPPQVQRLDLPMTPVSNSWRNITQPTDGTGTVRGSCIDMKTNQPVGCDAPLPPFPMVAPTMRDVVTHSQQWGCDDGYKQWWLTDGTANNFYEVCVTPEFIAELKKAKGEK